MESVGATHYCFRPATLMGTRRLEESDPAECGWGLVWAGLVGLWLKEARKFPLYTHSLFVEL